MALWGKPNALIGQYVTYIININTIQKAISLGLLLYKHILTTKATPLHVYTVHLNKWRHILRM